ncbi:ribosome small subunit-dependent GTPase A [Hugenholtzia roseola]|uniref:ribosome small subunit-dependent GTPase A n=1 Tax=Hugenholtzia roseola TaxID=1002 RepID=UPI00047AD9A6|nr:ribosome small subunit-dependent GTPase A [Hugenholtzia roseola]
MQKGLVLRSTGLWYDVVSEDNKRYKARLRGKIRLQNLKVTNPIAVGDWVFFEEETATDTSQIPIASIFDIEKRQNYIIRRAPKKNVHGHIIAANLDQAALVITLAMPRTSSGFIDRFLVSCETFRIPALLIFNKTDLLSPEEVQIQDKIREKYEQIGYPTLAVSATEDPSLQALEAAIQGKTTLFSGHSGVGKSTLLNRLAPHLNLRTQEISDFSEKGMHTTTFAEMFEFQPHTYLIDTPGIKELGLIEIGEDELSHYFPEMRELIGACKFHNCRHLHEPKCAVRQAVEEGKIAKSRYNSYLSMVENDDNRR